jgi:hypothetical protein
MKMVTSFLLAAFSAAACLLSGPQISLAQVWGIGPDGRAGYISTRNPISPNCPPPQVWTLTNGHYACENPVPPPPVCPAGTTQSVAPTWNGSAWVGLFCQPNAPTKADPQSVCMANLPAGWTISGPYQGRTGAPPAGELELDYAGSGQQGIIDKCGNPVLMNHLQCLVRTSDSAFIQWGSSTDFGTGSCGH